MGKYVDLTGKKFNKLTVIKYENSNKNGVSFWECLCDCGKTKIIRGSYLKSGHTSSCGCVKDKQLRGRSNKLEGDIFGRLTVISRNYPYNGHKGYFWNCKCECGNEVVVFGNNLKIGNTKSCGCLSNEVRVSHYTHHQSKTPSYIIWGKMIQRCTNKKTKEYCHYGGRGITICDKWLKFEGFYEDMGDRPEGLSIDRIDNNEGYYKENCRWATSEQQANNTRRNCFMTYNGKTQTVSQWAKEMNMNRGTLQTRISRNWTVEKILNTPVQIHNC